MEDRSEALFRYVASLSLFKKLMFSLISVIPLGCAAYGTYMLSRFCPYEDARKFYIGLMAAGMISSLFSLLWVISLFPSIPRANLLLAKRQGSAYGIGLIVIPFSIGIIVNPIGKRIHAWEATSCGPTLLKGQDQHGMLPGR